MEYIKRFIVGLIATLITYVIFLGIYLVVTELLPETIGIVLLVVFVGLTVIFGCYELGRKILE